MTNPADSEARSTWLAERLDYDRYADDVDYDEGMEQAYREWDALQELYALEDSRERAKTGNVDSPEANPTNGIP